MDAVPIRQNIQPQNSTCSFDSNGDENGKCDTMPLYKRLCLIGNLAQDEDLCSVAKSFNIPITSSETGEEYAQENNFSTLFVIESFDGSIFNNLRKTKQPLLGPPALRQLALRGERLPNYKTRPLFNLAMSGVVVCFTGFRNKEDLSPLVPLLIHHMGGSIRKELSGRVTHLIANVCGGEKYQYAVTFKLPVLNLQWVHASWDRRFDLSFSATGDSFIAEHKLKPFHGAKISFVGFPQEEEKHMTDVLIANGGSVATLEDPNLTHVVMEDTVNHWAETASSRITSPTPQNIPNGKYSANNNNCAENLFANNVSLNSSRKSISCLETVEEKSHDYDDTFLDSTISSINSLRKRKITPPQSKLKIKKKREHSFSEKRKQVSNFFKTPINFISNRRRTIHATSFNESVNSSILSSSGAFNIDTVEDLSVSQNEFTPKTSKKSRKSLFKRTFSSTKFLKLRRSSRNNLNLTQLSFAEYGRDEPDDDHFNSTCFPAINSANHELNCQYPGRLPRDSCGTNSVVVDESSVSERPESSSKSWIVKAEWFWTSVQKEVTQSEKEYLFDDYIEQVVSPGVRRDSHHATPSSASRRKRKRIHETIQSLVHQQSPSLHKRRSSVSDAGILSVSGSFLDCTASPEKVLEGHDIPVDTPRKALTARHQVFLELLQTESNYVGILETIMTMFKKHLEEMPEEEALLNNTELNLIFGEIPPIYDVHVKMLNDFKKVAQQWTEDKSIGSIIVRFSTELLKAYPPYINFFEEMKEFLMQCDQNKPRFHAFLKACQTRPECGRQSLQELMIRPVQRLGSISLLLNDILKNTQKTNPDHSALEQAQGVLREIMTHINEDKRKTEGQVTLFNIFNEIDNCPPDMVSSHRSFIAKSEVIQLSSSEGLSSKGNYLVLFLFSDQLEVCKKKSKSFNSLKSPGTTISSQRNNNAKPYKHVRLMALNTIKRVIDIKETEDCQKVFSLVCRHNDDLKERLYSFAMADEEADKVGFLKTLTKQMANNACTADADKFMAYLEPHQLDIDTSDLSNGTLSKAFKFATRTKMKVGRAFSFNKTPSKLKRAVSSMMSPFGSSTNLTPASQLAQMKLASYSNINELGNADDAPDSPPAAPLSVQPTRKLKASSLGVNAMKRL